MGSLSKLSGKCKLCPFVSKCNHKMMESLAYLEPKNSADLIITVQGEMLQPMAMKHDYRDIKIGEDTTVTIDIEEVKRQMKKDFYKKLGIGFYPGV